MKHDTFLSTMKASYSPRSFPGEGMGHHEPVKHGYGSLYEAKDVNYFRNYRSEAAPGFQMPQNEWGISGTAYSAKPNIATYRPQVSWDKMLTGNSERFSMIDPVRMNEIEDLYKLCQMFREQYNDRTGKIHSLDYFKPDEYKYHCPPDLTSTYVKFPTYYVKYKQPLTFPITYERTKAIPPLPHRILTGRYSRYADNSFKN